MHTYQIDTEDSVKPLDHYWSLCVGSCHAATALREDYRKQLRKCHDELGFQYVRFHGLFDDDMSVLSRNSNSGTTEESWTVSFTNIDSIYDFLLSINMKPFVELSFMPECLKTKPYTVFHYKGYISRPKSYEVWDWFIETFIRHLYDRYGAGEVRQWFFEVWNEPNLGGTDAENGFWAESMEEYYNLYAHTCRAIKKVDPRLRVGGPATSNNALIPEFIQACRDRDVPIDFISTHHYPTDVILGYGAEDSQNFFREMESESLEEKEKRQQAWHRRLWENVDRGVVTKMAEKAKEQAGDLPLYYTEWNSLAGLPSDGPFGASYILKTCMDNVGLVKGYSYWTFSDLFEEGGMPSKEFHGGFGLLTLHGIEKASYAAFRILNELGDELYESALHEGTMDIYGIRNDKNHSIQILAVNHHSLYHEIHDEEAEIVITHTGNHALVTAERIDENHANPLAAYEKMGSPEYPVPSEMAELHAASGLKREKIAFAQDDDAVRIHLMVPAMGSVLVTVYY